MNLLSSDTAFCHGADGEKAWFGLLYVREQLVEGVEGALKAEHDLPLSWFEVLLRLAAGTAAGEPFVSVSRVAEAVLLSPSRVSRVIDGLEERGLVERRPGERDARVSEVALTEAGLDFYRSADATHRRVVNEVFLAKLSPEEAEVISRVWRRLLSETGGAEPGRGS